MKDFFIILIILTFTTTLFTSKKIDLDLKEHVREVQKWTGTTPHQTFGLFAGLGIYSTYRSLANFFASGGYFISAINTGLTKLFNEPTNKSVLRQTSRGILRLTKSPLQLIMAAYFEELANTTREMYPKVKKDLKELFNVKD